MPGPGQEREPAAACSGGRYFFMFVSVFDVSNAHARGAGIELASNLLTVLSQSIPKLLPLSKFARIYFAWTAIATRFRLTHNVLESSKDAHSMDAH